jgi:hypothetical protein
MDSAATLALPLGRVRKMGGHNMSAELFPDIIVVGKMQPGAAAAKLRELGDNEAATAILQNEGKRDGDAKFQTFGILDAIGFGTHAWQHTSHVFGYLASGGPTHVPQALQHAGNIKADLSLRNARINISLGAIRVADYPGSGTHQILFDFYGQTSSGESVNHLHFNALLRAREGDDVAVLGYPIFVGLSVGDQGVSFGCLTVNVRNDEDEQFLSFLESDIFKSGLKLLETAQPALAPLAASAENIAKGMAKRYRNVAVQNFQMGLDFSKARFGARLAEGSFIAMQVPSEIQRAWNWDNLAFNPANGQIVNVKDPAQPIPYNYIIFNVSRFSE